MSQEGFTASHGANQPPSQTTPTPTLFSRPKLYELINSISYGERLEPSVEYALLKISEAFILEVASSAADLARHRQSRTIESKDVQLHLEREWDMTLPGFVEEEHKTNVRISHPTVAHQTRSVHAQRTALTQSHHHPPSHHHSSRP